MHGCWPSRNSWTQLSPFIRSGTFTWLGVLATVGPSFPGKRWKKKRCQIHDEDILTMLPGHCWFLLFINWWLMSCILYLFSCYHSIFISLYPPHIYPLFTWPEANQWINECTQCLGSTQCHRCNKRYLIPAKTTDPTKYLSVSAKSLNMKNGIIGAAVPVYWPLLKDYTWPLV